MSKETISYCEKCGFAFDFNVSNEKWKDCAEIHSLMCGEFLVSEHVNFDDDVPPISTDALRFVKTDDIFEIMVCLASAFSWSDTKQGITYWREVYGNLEALVKYVEKESSDEPEEPLYKW